MEDLLERDSELARLEQDRAAAIAGEGRASLIAGPAGLGKSRLLAEAESRARSRGMLVLRASGDEHETELPWGIAHDLLEPALAALDDDERERVTRGYGGRALEVLRGGATGAPGSDTTLAVTHGLFQLIVALAESRPVLIVVDDVHWCDPLGLRFLRYALRRLGSLTASAVVTVRSGDPGADRALAALGDVPRLGRIDLEPLGLASVAAIVAREVPEAAGPGTSKACLDLTGGNPLYLTQMLGDARRAGATVVADLEAVGSGSVARAVLTRLRRHGRDETALAQAVSVLGVTVAGIAAALAGLDVESALRAADALEGADILTVGTTVAFVHPLVRQAIHADMPSGKRGSAHARAAALLRQAGAPEDVVAEHLLAAPATGEQSTVDALCAAARRASAQGAPDQAVRLLRRAAAEPVAAGAHAAVLIELAQAEALAARPEAPSRLREALGQATDDEASARLLLALGWSLHSAGSPGEAAAAFEDGMARPGLDPELRGELEAGYLTASLLDATRASDAHVRVSMLLGTTSAPATPSQLALVSHAAVAALFEGRPAHEVIDLARQVDRAGDLYASVRGDSIALWNVIGSLSWCDRGDEAEAGATRALGSADAQGSISGRAMALYARSWPRLYAGRIEDSVRDSEEAVEIWTGGAQMYLPAAVYWLVWGLIEFADLAGAQAAVDDLEHEAASWQNTAFHGLTLAARARVAAAAGRPEEALHRWLECGEHMTGRMFARNPALVPWRSEAAYAALAVGDERAGEHADNELELAETFGAPRSLAAALRAAAVCGDAADREALLVRAESVIAESPAKLEAGRIQIELATVDRSHGRPVQARERLHRVREWARRSGARAVQARAESDLHDLGGRVRSEPSVNGASSLTASESRVVRLAIEGQSNQEIALALFVTVKAVEWHLSNVYRKLGIRRRGQLAAALQADEAA